MEVSSVVGYHDVNNVKARELLQPHLGTNGFYLLRPSSDRKGGVLCTICVTNNNKLMNYRLARDAATGRYFIFPHTMFPNIQLLLAYYKSTPINADVNTLLLYPVTPPDPRQQQHEEDGEDAYVVMERPPASAQEDDGQIPGLHEFLPKSEIGTVMNNYLSTDGWYLLRPSSTSEGQLTLAVSHGGRILNFKINGDGNQFYIAPKKRFNSVRALLDSYKTAPIRSKKYGNQKIFLLRPIPVDKKQEDMFKQKLELKVAKKLSSTNLLPDPLPEPWQEHYDERYKRCYYYNPQTKQSSWERPKAPPTTSTISTPAPSKTAPISPRLPSRSDSMQGRALPAIPGSASAGDDGQGKSRRMSDVTGSMPPRQRRAQQPLPAIPGGKEETSDPRPVKSISQRRNTENKRNFVRNVPDIKETPALPSKDVPAVPGRGGSRGALPALPPKEDSPSHVARSPNMNRRPQMPLPEKQEPGNRFQRKGTPSLPPKEPEKAVPQLPQKQPNGSIPPLPPKEMSPPVAQEAEKPLPPLPPKLPKSPSPPPKAGPPPSSNRKPKKKIVEYEDFPIRQPPKSKMNVPPLPEKEDKVPAAAPPPPPVPVVNGAPPPPPPTQNGGAPPPPPPPLVGVPVPPPPPPNAPPSPNPAAAFSRKAPSTERTQSTSSNEEGGRPFTANDLAQAKNLLKKRKEMPEDDKRGSSANSGIAGVFANAIDSRMMSIRKAMVDSDSGESEFEDVDDEDWDD